jgi:hypothetical protein
MNRGDRREPIFKDDKDREVLLETLGQSAAAGNDRDFKVDCTTIAVGNVDTCVQLPWERREIEMSKVRADTFLRPAAEAAGVMLRLAGPGVPGKIRTLKERQNLGKQTAGADHFRSPWLRAGGLIFHPHSHP